jgi:hemolysin III
MTAACDNATTGEEIANTITHGVGALLSAAGLVALVAAAASTGTPSLVIACAVYGASLVLLYLSSTLYHALTNRRVKHVFRILDHVSIYLVIAGTYTPFTLVTLSGVRGWVLFGIVWTLALTGIFFKCFFTGRRQMLSTVVYVLMGWVAVVAIQPLFEILPLRGFLLLLSGGLLYTLGVAFFGSSWKYSHAVWHLFVLAGSVCHFIAVYAYVVPRPD